MMQSAFAVTAAAAIAVTPFIGSASAAHADGANGEVRGYLWTGTVGSNWEGTYRMPDGSEAWCAQIWAPEPIHADEYGAETTLTLNNGAPLTAERMQQLAYIISEASDRVIDKTGKEADDYAAATSVIVHDWTNSGSQPYDPEWPLALFDAGDDPGGTGQQPNDVRDVYDLLIANAQQYSGAWTLDLDEVTAPDRTVGDEITVSGTLETASGNAIPDHEVHLAANGGALADETVTTDANGAFSTTITVEAASVSVDASRIAPASEVKMREPIAWDGGSRPQNMILVSDNVVSAEIEFDAKPQPVEPWIGTSATDQSDGDRVLS
ncbi:MAG: Ig-like domain-containing protein, partial [Actinomycetaceae bacterium]